MILNKKHINYKVVDLIAIYNSMWISSSSNFTCIYKLWNFL